MTRPAAKTIFEQGLGLFGAPADALLLDEIVAIAYEERRKRTNSAMDNTRLTDAKESEKGNAPLP